MKTIVLAVVAAMVFTPASAWGRGHGGGGFGSGGHFGGRRIGGVRPGFGGYRPGYGRYRHGFGGGFGRGYYPRYGVFYGGYALVGLGLGVNYEPWFWGPRYYSDGNPASVNYTTVYTQAPAPAYDPNAAVSNAPPPAVAPTSCGTWNWDVAGAHYVWNTTPC